MGAIATSSVPCCEAVNTSPSMTAHALLAKLPWCELMLKANVKMCIGEYLTCTVEYFTCSTHGSIPPRITPATATMYRAVVECIMQPSADLDIHIK